MSETYSVPTDARFTAQERILDALLRVLALRDPALLEAVKTVLLDTAFTHPGTPDEAETVQQQVRRRLTEARAFAEAHGSGDSG